MISRTVNLYKNAYSGLTDKIWLLSIVMLINRCGTMVLAFMTLYCNHLGFTVKQGGLVVAIYGMGAGVGALVGGKISDRFGFYYTQFVALFAGGVMFMVLGQMTTYLSICICIFFLSMINESFRPANATAIAHYSSVENRTQSYALVRLSVNLGWGIGSALGGFLASINYHLLFWVDGFTNIAASFMLLLLLPKVTKYQQLNIGKNELVVNKISSPYRDKKFLYFLGFQLFFAACFFQLFTNMPLFFKEGLHLSEFNIGVVMAANGIMIAIFEMVIVFKLEGKRPYLSLISYGSFLMAISFLLLNLPIANGFLIAAFTMFVITIAEMISLPFMNSFYIGRSSDNTRGQYAGLYTMTWSAAQVISSFAGAAFAYAYGFINLWFVVCAICMLAGAGFYWLKNNGGE
ncbi:MAG: MFS transporter [Ferruginibacter sp.]|nr:MFS transporter [Ferruginibacter sp.]